MRKESEGEGEEERDRDRECERDKWGYFSWQDKHKSLEFCFLFSLSRLHVEHFEG